MMLAGLIAYGASQTLNVYIFARLTAKKGGRFCGCARWIASFLSQIVDTLLFITIAFYGVRFRPIGRAAASGPDHRQAGAFGVMVPPLIYLFVALGRRLDAQMKPKAPRRPAPARRRPAAAQPRRTGRD